MVEGEALYVWQQSDSCRVEVDLARRGDRPIPRLLFGKFTEHLGRNVYNGMWAQVLRNPGFESWRYFAESKEQLRAAYGHAQSPVAPGLLAADPEATAAWWMPYGDGEVRYALDGEARNSALCQRVEVQSLRSDEAGVQQPVCLPTHRTQEYRVELCEFYVSLWARSPQPGGTLRLSVATAEGVRVASAQASLPGTSGGTSR